MTALSSAPTTPAEDPARHGPDAEAAPWYRTTLRWGQTNLTEVDPQRYDVEWWRAQWRRTRVQGVIVNAGGIVAYYPSRFPLHRRARFLGDRDLYGEIVSAARADGLAVLARMDSSRADERFHVEHPDWFTVDAAGTPHRAGELFVACVNSPYYDDYLPQVLAEVVERSAPDGFADNSWSGLERDRICHCHHCRAAFEARCGRPVPTEHDWDDETYRLWVRWNYDRRLEIWDANNALTRRLGGEHCLWLGMNAGGVAEQSRKFRDLRGICQRSPLLLLDWQWRRGQRGFHDNADAGKLVHGLLGWDRLVPESTALYDAGQPTFRLGSKPPVEARLWAADGMAAGIQPWWHHIGSASEDRRQYSTAEELFGWHEQHQDYLVDRTPVAGVGVVWSQENQDVFGRDDAEERVGAPYRGVVDALVQARIPYLPVHADDLGAAADRFDVLVLPDVGALSQQQCEAVRRFAAAGGGVVASGETARYDLDGRPRPDSALSELLGVSSTGRSHGTRRSAGTSDQGWDTWSDHTYLRLEQRAHPVLAGLGDTELLAFSGRLQHVTAGPDTHVLATFVPAFPIYPPETSWMRTPSTGVPALVVREPEAAGRVVYLAADLDRCFGRDHHPDHAEVLTQAVRWAARRPAPLAVEGPGLLDCHLYRQGARRVLHLVNLTHGVPWTGQLAETVPVGPVSVRLPDVGRATVRLLVAGRGTPSTSDEQGACTFTIERLDTHEVCVIEPVGPDSRDG